VSANWKNVDGRQDGRWENSRGRDYREEGEWKRQTVKKNKKTPKKPEKRHHKKEIRRRKNQGKVLRNAVVRDLTTCSLGCAYERIRPGCCLLFSWKSRKYPENVGSKRVRMLAPVCQPARRYVIKLVSHLIRRACLTRRKCDTSPYHTVISVQRKCIGKYVQGVGSGGLRAVPRACNPLPRDEYASQAGKLPSCGQLNSL